MAVVFHPLSNEISPFAFDQGGYNDDRHPGNPENINYKMLSPRLLDHFENPRNVGLLDAPAVTVERMNPVCGDILRLSARFDEGKAVEVRYQARGCTACLAMGSAVTELIQGRSGEEIVATTVDEIETALGGLIAESKHVAVLGVETLRALAAAAGIVVR